MLLCVNTFRYLYNGDGRLVDKVSASYLRDGWFEIYTCHDQVSSYGISTGQSKKSRIIHIITSFVFMIFSGCQRNNELIMSTYIITLSTVAFVFSQLF